MPFEPDRGAITDGVSALGVPQKPELQRARAVVAASTRLMPQTAGQYSLRIKREAWTVEAWRQYDICGELHFATNWLANSCGRCHLTICEIDSAGRIGAPTKNKEILALASGLLMNPGMQNELIVQAVKNLTIAGDGYILAEPNADGLFDQWTALSTRQIQNGLNGGYLLNIGDNEPREIDAETNILQRIHRPHPDLWYSSDSPTRAALPILRELEELSKYLFATINSRLAGAGILAIPSEASFPSPTGELQPGETPFMATLAEGMLAPIEDMSSPSALVPIVIEAPAATIAAIQWITSPNSTLTTVIAELRKAAIERLSLSLDLSPDTLFGSGNSSRWGQWTLEEQSIKFHIEPVMIVLCQGLTKGFLTPAGTAAGLITPDGKQYVFWYDAADLVQRADQSAQALNLYDRGELSGEALRRENGFQESDAPTGTELALRQLLRLVALAPNSADLLLPEIARVMAIPGLDPSSLVVPAPSATGTPPQDTPPDPNEPSRPAPKKAPAPKTAPNRDGKQPADRT